MPKDRRKHVVVAVRLAPAERAAVLDTAHLHGGKIAGVLRHGLAAIGIHLTDRADLRGRHTLSGCLRAGVRLSLRERTLLQQQARQRHLPNLAALLRLALHHATGGKVSMTPLPRLCCLIQAWGEARSVRSWLKDPRCHATRNLIWVRLHRGWSPEDALGRPPGRPGRPRKAVG